MTGRQALEAQLRGRAPAGMEGLSDAQFQALADAIRDARHRQGAELAAAGDKALGLVPRMLRVPLRRVLG